MKDNMNISDMSHVEADPQVLALIRLALEEDVGGGDVTTLALVAPHTPALAVIAARTDMTVAGLSVAAKVFDCVDPTVRVELLCRDGEAVTADTAVLRLDGPARAILTGERTALNLLQRLCGIATATTALAAKAKNTGTLILDTRKTAPGMRVLDKYAVACGGGTNHRRGLYDAVLIKDNHLTFWRENQCGSLADAVEAARTAYPDLKIEVEVDTLEQLKEVIPAKPDWVLLDNMSPDVIRQAVAMCAGICQTEASGGIEAARLAEYLDTGVTAISIGALTHSVKAADLGLDFMPRLAAGGFACPQGKD